MSHFKALQSREDFYLTSSSSQGAGYRISGAICQYLRSFQLDSCKFLADHLLVNPLDGGCILNDQSGLGKTVAVVAFLSALGNKPLKALIVVNDESKILNWQYHFEKLGKIGVGIIDHDEGKVTCFSFVDLNLIIFFFYLCLPLKIDFFDNKTRN